VVTAANAMLDDMVGGLRQRFPEHQVLLWDANRAAVSAAMLHWVAVCGPGTSAAIMSI
jgi:hypothetical protein